MIKMVQKQIHQHLYSMLVILHFWIVSDWPMFSFLGFEFSKLHNLHNLPQDAGAFDLTLS